MIHRHCETLFFICLIISVLGGHFVSVHAQGQMFSFWANDNRFIEMRIDGEPVEGHILSLVKTHSVSDKNRDVVTLDRSLGHLILGKDTGQPFWINVMQGEVQFVHLEDIHKRADGIYEVTHKKVKKRWQTVPMSREMRDDIIEYHITLDGRIVTLVYIWSIQTKSVLSDKIEEGESL